MTRLEFALRNYLNKHNIFKDNEGMQTIIINSFYRERGLDNEDDWFNKVVYCQKHFGLFCQYAQNNWKMAEK